MTERPVHQTVHKALALVEERLGPLAAQVNAYLEMENMTPAQRQLARQCADDYQATEAQQALLQQAMKKVEENGPVEGDQAARLERIKAIIASVDWGRDLLDLAEKNGYVIELRQNMQPMQCGSVLENVIAVRGQMNDADILLSLVHELRHVWQICHWDLAHSDDIQALTVDGLIFKRIVEGDANAFVSAFAQKLIEANGDMLPVLMTAEFNNVPDADETMQSKFWSFQGGVRAQGYDRVALATVKSVKDYADPLNAEQKEELRAGFNAAATPLNQALNRILIQGLAKEDPRYIDCKSVEDLAAAVQSYIPADTLQKLHGMLTGIGAIKPAISKQKMGCA